jgi:hypothetical protein
MPHLLSWRIDPRIRDRYQRRGHSVESQDTHAPWIQTRTAPMVPLLDFGVMQGSYIPILPELSMD